MQDSPDIDVVELIGWHTPDTPAMPAARRCDPRAHHHGPGRDGASLPSVKAREEEPSGRTDG